MKKLFSKTTLAVIGLILLVVVGVYIIFWVVRDTLKPVAPQDNDALVVINAGSDTGVVIKESNNKRWYEEDFTTPLDTTQNTDKHKEVYENIKAHVSFAVKYPTELPEGFKLIKTFTQPVYATSSKSDSYTVTYHNPQTGAYIYVMGSREKDFISEFVEEEVVLNETKKGDFVRQYQTVSVYVYDSRDGEDVKGSYSVSSQMASKEDLINVARSLERI